MQSDVRTFSGAAMLILGRIGVVVSAIYGGALVIYSRPAPYPLWIVGGCSLALTFMAARVLKTPSLTSQVALQSCAVAGLALGITILARCLRLGWDGVLGRSGAVGFLVLLFGVGSAFAMKWLQARTKI
jgi:hypothetical protein